MTFIRSFHLYTGKILYTRSLSPVARIPRKVHSRVTSDSDVCKIDLDVKMSYHFCATEKRKTQVKRSDSFSHSKSLSHSSGLRVNIYFSKKLTTYTEEEDEATPTSSTKGLCVFRCNLPPALRQNDRVISVPLR